MPNVLDSHDKPIDLVSADERRAAEAVKSETERLRDAILAEKAKKEGPQTGAEATAVRGTTHGRFPDNAKVSQQLQFVMSGSKNWNELSNTQREALQLIAHKIGRILSGDPNFKDHWVDIAGYAELPTKDWDKV